MDNESTKDSSVLGSPQPLAPHGAAVVDGRSVTFRWEPVDDARAYRIEVADDTSFGSVVFEKEMPPDQTSLTVADFFPVDDQTFFWRVLAKGEGEWSRGERVESFVSGTAADVEKHIRTPDEEEDVGPIGGLMHSTSEMVTEELKGREETLEQRLQREREQGVAYEGIPSGQILAIAVSILFAVAIIVILLFQWTSFTAAAIRTAAVDPANYTTLQQVEEEAERKLSGYEAISEEEGTYRIPIDRAMELVVDEVYQQEDRTYSPEAPFVQDAVQ